MADDDRHPLNRNTLRQSTRTQDHSTPQGDKGQSPPFAVRPLQNLSDLKTDSVSTNTTNQNGTHNSDKLSNGAPGLDLRSASLNSTSSRRTIDKEVSNICVEPADFGHVPELVRKRYEGRWYRYNFSENDPLYIAGFFMLYAFVIGFLLRGGSHFLHTVAEAGFGAFCFFMLLRSLPQLSFTELARAERRVLAHVSTQLQAYWTSYTCYGIEWSIHSVCTHTNTSLAPGADTKPDIVVVHGHSAAHAHWEPIIDSLSKFANLHMVNLPGWGRSPAPAKLRESSDLDEITELHVQFLRGWMSAHNIERAYVVGHSIGGWICANTAYAYPQKFQKLIVTSPCGVVSNMTTGHLWTFLMAYASPQKLLYCGGRILYGIFRSFYIRNTAEHIAFADYYSQLAAATAYTGNCDTLFGKFVQYRRCFTQGFWARPILDKLVQCKVPLAIIWGKFDDLFPSNLANILQKARPDSRTYVLDESLHNPAHNNATEFVAAIRKEIFRHIRPRSIVSKRHDMVGDQSPLDSSRPREMRSHTVDTNFIWKYGKNPPELSEEAQDCDEDETLEMSSVSSSSSTIQETRRRRAFSAGPTCRAHLDLVPYSAPSSGQSLSRSEANRGLIAFTGRSYSLSRGVCIGCSQRVQLLGPYFHCGCGAWMFYHHIQEKDSHKEFKRMLAFLQELYGDQSFDARKSKHIKEHNWVDLSKHELNYKPEYPSLTGLI
eukprot:gb/GECG01009054.1/.p1 GENE.gb/GECG01009054.1/~~gb/GECG01009054.1/.p1  ORF type:complete len:714 (+),score=48.93 gb/GECG01009054.1/:1-2142(+)